MRKKYTEGTPKHRMPNQSEYQPTSGPLFSPSNNSPPTLSPYFLVLKTLRPPAGASTCARGATFFPAAFTGAGAGACTFLGAGAAAVFPLLTTAAGAGVGAWTLEDLGERMVDGGGGGALERDAARARAREAVRVAGAVVVVGGCGLVRVGAVREVVRFAGGAVVTGAAGAGAGFGLVRFLGLGRAGYGAVVVGMFSLSRWSLWDFVSFAARAHVGARLEGKGCRPLSLHAARFGGTA